jgi:outer membrane lipoprotein SlyB
MVLLKEGSDTAQRRVDAMKMKIMALVGLLVMLGGCGTLVGAGAGGYAGSQFGEGSGKAAATAGGVIGGAVIGHALTGD